MKVSLGGVNIAHPLVRGRVRSSAPTCVLAVFCVLCFVCFGALGRSLCFVFCVLAFARGTLLSRKRYALCFRFEGAPQAPILGGKMDSTY